MHQHAQFQFIPSMHSPEYAKKPSWTDGQTDVCVVAPKARKTVMVGPMDQQTHVQVERGYFRLRMDGQMDRWMDNPET